MQALPAGFTGTGMTIALFLAAFVIYKVALGLMRRAIRRVARGTKATWDDRIIERRVFARLGNAIPAAVVYFGIGPALGLTTPEILAAGDSAALVALLTQRVALSMIVLSAVLAANALLNAINDKLEKASVGLNAASDAFEKSVSQ